MKQISSYFKVFLLLTMSLSCTNLKAQVNDYFGSWTSEIEAKSDDYCFQNWYLYRLKLNKNSKFEYEEGFKRIFMCEQQVGAFIYAKKSGTYTVEDSTLILSFDKSPVTYDHGPIFTRSHGETTREDYLHNFINPTIESYKEITKAWVDKVSSKPWKTTIVVINKNEMSLKWDEVSDEGAISHNIIKFKKQ